MTQVDGFSPEKRQRELAQDGEVVPREALLAHFVPGEGPPEGLTAVPTAARGSKNCYTGLVRRGRETSGHDG
jgi:hypothetical protein